LYTLFTSLQTTYINDHTIVTLTLILYYFQKKISRFLDQKKKTIIKKKSKRKIIFNKYFEILFFLKMPWATSTLLKLFVKKVELKKIKNLQRTKSCEGN
jgi:hypothetical protein